DPLTSARTRWMFGFQRRFVRRCECDTDMPHEGFLPQTSHTEAMVLVLRHESGRVAGRSHPFAKRQAWSNDQETIPSLRSPATQAAKTSARTPGRSLRSLNTQAAKSARSEQAPPSPWPSG